MSASGSSPLPPLPLYPQASAPPLCEPPPAYGDISRGTKSSTTGDLPPHPNQPHSYPPPPTHGYPQPEPLRATGPVYVGSIAYNRTSQQMHCPYCSNPITTKTSLKAGLLTYLLCGGLAFFGCWLCCCIPFCLESAQDVEHTCPRCNRFLGRYKRI